MTKGRKTKERDGNSGGMDRRTFLGSAAALGAGFMLAPEVAAAGEASTDELNVAIIGSGAQGMVLLRDALKIPGIRFRAVCDIWDYSRRYASGVIRKSRQPAPALYTDYREMLAAERDLDAAVVATPDWMHAEHTVACLDAGLHVYCEKEMSNTPAEARRIVEAARRSGKKVQIGHQRRSNPFYMHALQLIEKDQALGRITNCYGQWNRAAQPKASVPDRLKIPDETLEKYGYGTMDRFRNWRWYRKFSGGPMADLGSHQVDIFNWFLRTPPTSVVAQGGRDYYQDGREWYDGAMVVYEYRPQAGAVQAFYQVLNTTSFRGYYETFMGDTGALNVSEDLSKCFYVPEPTKRPPEWVDRADRVEKEGSSAIKLIGESRKDESRAREELVTGLEKPIHQYHLENFFAAVRDGVPLNCPPEDAYRTAVSVLGANGAIEGGGRVEFSPDEFTV
ncbi:MAG: Gfo/Idh/MocA family protein [Planctomycetota bacterium]